MSQEKNSAAEPLEKGAQAAGMVKGAVKTGKALAGAAKGAAARWPIWCCCRICLGKPQAAPKNNFDYSRNSAVANFVYFNASCTYFWRSYQRLQPGQSINPYLK